MLINNIDAEIKLLWINAGIPDTIFLFYRFFTESKIVLRFD